MILFRLTLAMELQIKFKKHCKDDGWALFVLTDREISWVGRHRERGWGWREGLRSDLCIALEPYLASCC